MADITRKDLAAFAVARSHLMEYAHAAHAAVCERIDAVTAICTYPDMPPPLESRREFVERVYVKSHPIPADQYGAEEGNRYYEDVRVALYVDKGEREVEFLGMYPKWNGDGSDYKLATGHVSVPDWFFEPDGLERYRKWTDVLVKAVEAEQSATRRKIETFVDEVTRG